MQKLKRGRTGRGGYRRRLKRARLAAPRRMLGITRSNLVSIKRTRRVADFTVGMSWNSQAYVFTLASLQNYTEFTNLFEQYRINAIKLTFIPQVNGCDAEQQASNAAGGVAYNSNPIVYTIIDKDGSATTSTEDAMLQYGNARIIRGAYKPWTIYIKGPS